MEIPHPLPRVAISFCTQCKWMLRAAWFAQELLSTFSTAIGEVALIPTTGGVFTVELVYIPQATEEPSLDEAEEAKAKSVVLWDRKVDGGFPEAKVLKQRLRDHIDPSKDLGHADRKPEATTVNATSISSTSDCCPPTDEADTATQ